MQAGSVGHLPAPRRPSRREAAATVLRCRGFGVAFGSRTVFSSLDCDLASGSITILGGASGSGKSTLLHTLAGHSRLNARFRCWGEASYLGEPLGRRPDPWLARLDARLLQMPVLVALKQALRVRPQRPGRPGRELVEAELRALGAAELEPWLGRRGIELPPRLLRALPILISVLRGAPLLLLDEPTAGLSGGDADFVLALIRAAAQRSSVLAVLENGRHAERLGTQELVLAGGRIGIGESCGQAPGGETADDAAPPSRAGAFAPASPARCAAAPAPGRLAWLLSGRLAGTALASTDPQIDTALAALARAGVNRLVTLCEKDIPLRVLARHGLANLHLAVREGEAPSTAQMRMLLIRMQALLDQGEVLAVHCGDGADRTGTVLAAWLMHSERIPAEAALARLRGADPGFAGKAVQERFLSAFGAALPQDREGRGGSR
ncbi:ATP-binding cassette domain-containing protein [Caldimonas tepidiphila]|uniref:phosphatase domain-containing putative toxin n=1 Tax=Caldimonas tepidiphila TaxID=2315841 RepID=UPI0013006872|nr:ATP-binding cassette domain-containing protein [Caldimonas tepidiphila]